MLAVKIIEIDHQHTLPLIIIHYHLPLYSQWSSTYFIRVMVMELVNKLYTT